MDFGISGDEKGRFLASAELPVIRQFGSARNDRRGVGQSKEDAMTLGSFVVRNTFRNKRRSLLTMISISFSLLLLTLMICIWRAFYVDQVAPEASRRLIIRDRISLAFFLPAFYREKIRAVPGVTAVGPIPTNI
jgi:hypothetical protein